MRAVFAAIFALVSAGGEQQAEGEGAHQTISR